MRINGVGSIHDLTKIEDSKSVDAVAPDYDGPTSEPIMLKREGTGEDERVERRGRAGWWEGVPEVERQVEVRGSQVSWRQVRVSLTCSSGRVLREGEGIGGEVRIGSKDLRQTARK